MSLAFSTTINTAPAVFMDWVRVGWRLTIGCSIKQNPNAPWFTNLHTHACTWYIYVCVYNKVSVSQFAWLFPSTSLKFHFSLGRRWKRRRRRIRWPFMLGWMGPRHFRTVTRRPNPISPESDFFGLILGLILMIRIYIYTHTNIGTKKY